VLVSGGIGVLVSGGIGVLVSGGIGVFVLVGIGVFVLVGGMCVDVLVGTKVAVKGGRARLVTVGVAVTKRGGVGGVEVLDGRGVKVAEKVFVGTRLGDGTNAVTACWVSAATVSMLENAKSTILTGWTVTSIWLCKSLIPMAETLHNRLKPIAPAARIPRGPAYSLAFTLIFLLKDFGGSCVVCSGVSSGVVYSDSEIIPHFRS
jgi:hypothetical protein